ncbi:MAG: hypothetical protein NT062_33190 [Proteobacteria bacterium]|nr:hypothetical protein [Pseudomonadota bacterium]
MNRRGLLALALLGGPLAACKDTQIVVGGLHEVTSLRAIPNRALDILFVVDDSPSMQDEQASLATNFPHMMDVLGELDGGLPDVHIGVITSDLGTSGGPAIGSGPGSCAGFGDAGALQGGFLSDVVVDGVRVRSYSGELRDAFTQLALVGETGCGFEQHLGALRAALTNPANAGFLRPEANLAVVILADEDDCTANADLFAPAGPELGPIDSFRCFARGVVCDGDDPTTPGAKTGCVPRSSRYMDDVQPFVTALLATKADARMIMTAAIVGPPTPVEVTLASVGGGSARRWRRSARPPSGWSAIRASTPPASPTPRPTSRGSSPRARSSTSATRRPPRRASSRPAPPVRPIATSSSPTRSRARGASITCGCTCGAHRRHPPTPGRTCVARSLPTEPSLRSRPTRAAGSRRAARAASAGAAARPRARRSRP